MNEWKEYQFSDAIEICPTVILKGDDSYSFVEMKDLSVGNRYCYPSTERKLSGGARFQNRDTLFARITPCLENGKICQVTGLKNGVGFGSTEFLVFRGKELITENDFVFYLSRSEDVRSFAEQNFDGTSGRQRVPKSAFNNLKILIPTLYEQRAIAGLLSSLDDKIDVLHQQNKTLEGMAETLWRKMFVEEADKENWITAKVKDMINVLSGFAFKSSDFVDSGKYRLITIKNVQDGYIDLSRTDYLAVTPQGMPDYCLLKKGDILLSLTGNVGRCGLVNEEDLLLNQRVAKLHARNVRDSAYTYIMFRQPAMRRTLEELAKGTAQANLSPVETASYEIQIPPDEVLESYSEEATPLIKKVLNNFDHIRILSRLRDTLLPKLISGEVRVKL